MPVAALKLPVMPFWLVKPSTSSPVTKLAVICTVAPARLVLSTSRHRQRRRRSRVRRLVLGVGQRCRRRRHDRRVVDRGVTVMVRVAGARLAVPSLAT